MAITRRDVLRSSVALAATAGSVAVGSNALAAGLGGTNSNTNSKKKKQPNIFFIISDELRADAVGFMGSKTAKTPHLDAFAKDCAKFTNYHCNSPMCVPSRVSIATGRHAMSHGAVDNMLEPLKSERSIYSMLNEKGYLTFNHGKWHSNIDPEEFGIQYTNGGHHECTFPELAVSCFGISDPALRKTSKHTKSQGEISLIISGTRPSAAEDTLDSVVTRNYIEQIESLNEKMPDKPLFARLSIMDPHTPYLPSEPYASMFDPAQMKVPESFGDDLSDKPIVHQYFYHSRRFNELNAKDIQETVASYSGLVTHVDDRVGNVVDYLKEKDLYDDSLIVFVADHGAMLGEHGFVEKWGIMYEEVLRTPFLIKFPNGQYGGQTFDSLVDSVDIMPTILELLDMEIPNNVQGKSLLPYLEGKTETHKDEIYAQYFCGGLQNESALCVKDKRWKLTSYPEGHEIEKHMPLDHPLSKSFLFDQEDVKGELYDLEKDPYERHNLFNKSEYADIKKKYLNKIEGWKGTLLPVVKQNFNDDSMKANLCWVLQGKNSQHVREMFSDKGKTDPVNIALK
ncbi:sulfatase-like hydrolase/transferase, partial [Vibrio sp. FNV 38]|nr:sulfatase-like hydrolase/transferase [Vibrio sp. FNV 38]